MLKWLAVARIALLVAPIVTMDGAARPLQVWRLSAPILDVAGVDGDGFGSVAGALRLPSGGVVVADAQAPELLYFDPRGTLVAKGGRRGDGPGEFRSIRALLRCAGDSAFVYDPALLRISVYSPEGRYVRMIDLRDVGIGIPPYDAYCDGAGQLVFVNRSPSPPAAVGPRRPLVELTTLYASAATVKSLATFPASERYFTGREDIPRPLGQVTLVGAGARAIYVSTGRAEARDGLVEIRALRPDGRALESVRVNVPRVSVTRGDVQRYVEERAGARSSRADGLRVRQLLESLKYPEEYPPLAHLLVDTGGNLWVSEYAPPGAAEVRWQVIAPDGALRAVLRVPSSLEIVEVRNEALLGIWRDDAGLARVRAYRLLKDSRAP